MNAAALLTPVGRLGIEERDGRITNHAGGRA